MQVVAIVAATSTLVGCPAEDPPAPQSASATYESVLAQLDAEIESAQGLAETHEDWARWATLSKLHSRRARLTGRFEDWAKAERSLKSGFDLAPEGGGPVMERAQLHLALHRVDEAARDLDRLEAVPLTTGERVRAVEVLRGDLALQTGALAQARTRFEALHASSPAPSIATRMALLERERGHFEQAHQWWERARRADKRDEPEVRAWYSLQRGLVELARGRYEAALRFYDQADNALPGWWLVEEHRAEALAELGRDDAALEIYVRVVDATGHPELLDALAALEPDPEKKRDYFTRARVGHEARMAMFPAAARGHYIDHLLAADPKRPDLAGLTEQETTTRPNAAAWNQRARANLAVDHPRPALDAIQSALQTGACNVSLFETAESVYRRVGDDAKAAVARTQRSRPDPCSGPKTYPSQPP